MDIETVLKEKGQEHVLRFFGELSPKEREELLAQIGGVDWEMIALKNRREELRQTEISPVRPLSVAEMKYDRFRYSAIGKRGIALGYLAAVMLAGGQGTRLGTDAPKGTFDIGCTRPRSIFEQLIRNLRRVTDKNGAVPLLIMTSEKNDAVTRAFFEEHDYFGYPREFVRFFVQEMAPCVDREGKLLLEERGKLAFSPNGNGGWYSSLMRSGVMADFPNVKWFNVFSVDNVLQRIADPVFFGATLLSGCNCGAKGVIKTDPSEKVGVLCNEGRCPRVIEYYEMPEDCKNLRDESGKLVFSFGVILNYLFRADKLREIADKKLPVHVVAKKVSCIDERGERVEPQTENGYKFETLILDMVRLMGDCLPFEVVREWEFAPIKNLTGPDSVETAREMLRRTRVKL